MTQDTDRVQTLDYATPRPAETESPVGGEHFTSRVAFAIGLGLMAAGLGASIDPNAGGWAAMGLGGIFVGLSCPLRFNRPG